MDGISALIEEAPESPPPPLPREEVTARRRPGQRLNLGLLSPQNCEKHISAVHKPRSLWGFAGAACVREGSRPARNTCVLMSDSCLPGCPPTPRIRGHLTLQNPVACLWGPRGW